MAVMIGIDPHKRSHTAVAINGTDEVLGHLRVTANRRQLDRLLAVGGGERQQVGAVGRWAQDRQPRRTVDRGRGPHRQRRQAHGGR